MVVLMTAQLVGLVVPVVEVVPTPVRVVLVIHLLLLLFKVMRVVLVPRITLRVVEEAEAEVLPPSEGMVLPVLVVPPEMVV